MEANVTLNKSFLSRRISGDYEIPGEIKLSNGKEFDLYFLVDQKIIEVTHKVEKKEKSKLTHEERMAIIESILANYTLFWKSVYHFTISYYIELFRLADTTNLSSDVDISDVVSNKTILQEFLDSDYSKKSTNKVFRKLKTAYDFINDPKGKIGKKQTTITINCKMNKIEWSDFKYYINNIFHCIMKVDNLDIKFDKTKDTVYIIIEPKELD